MDGDDSRQLPAFLSHIQHGTFQVRAIGTDYALSLMCGASVTECTMSRWFTFMGTYNEDIGVPFNIKFVPTAAKDDDGQKLVSVNSSISVDIIRPPLTRVYMCSEAAHPGGSPCSCQDCPQSCVAESPFPHIMQVSIAFFTLKAVC